MILIHELKKQYDSLSLKNIESTATHLMIDSSKNREKFILTLYYLKCTDRYREAKEYKNSTFAQYISAKYNLSTSAFEKERFAYVSVPEATHILGVGLIGKIQEMCGSHNVSIVVKKILDSKVKSLEAYDAIIADNAYLTDKKTKKQKQIAEYINEDLEQQHEMELLMQRIKELETENNRLKAENNRLMDVFSKVGMITQKAVNFIKPGMFVN